jgi:biofilm PGA synthesis N-glycosyltransferase PgaC
VHHALQTLVHSHLYTALIFFVGVYPIATSLYWLAGSVAFWRHREVDDARFYELDEFPCVSVLLAAHNEEAVIGDTIRRVLEIDWPDLEIVVVDDGSTDATPRILADLAEAGSIRYVRKDVNEGKAMALNDGIPLVRGELMLVIDADARPQPDVLRWMVPHFVKVPRVAAVTGNPRVVNTTTLLTKLQAIEFSATVSVLRRAQATWGRLMTFSGICTMLRRSAVESVGRFKPEMATEDIALAWQLQRAYYDVRYEPHAIFGMEVPETFAMWWRQRKRWGRGMGQVLRRNSSIMLSWRTRRLWPVFAEAVASTLWSYLFVALVVVWSVAYPAHALNFGANPIPNFWGMLIASVAILQIFCGLWLDGRYDHSVRRYALWVPLYPLAYWALTAVVSVRSTAGGFLRRPSGAVTWTQQRYGNG